MGLFSRLFGSTANVPPASKRQAGSKPFKLRAEDMVTLIGAIGGGMVSDHIVVDGLPVGSMTREEPTNEADSGWVFMSGKESQAYADEPSNWSICALNTIANYDRTIIPYLGLPVGTLLDRVAGTTGFRGPDGKEVKPVEAEMLHPEFPKVEGRYQMTSDWAVTLPMGFNRRVEDGSMVFWRPGITVWTVVWKNNKNESREVRLEKLRNDASPEMFDVEVITDREVVRYSYRLKEAREKGTVHALYGFAIGSDGHVQMAIYFDLEGDLALARQVWLGLEEIPGTER